MELQSVWTRNRPFLLTFLTVPTFRWPEIVEKSACHSVSTPELIVQLRLVFSSAAVSKMLSMVNAPLAFAGSAAIARAPVATRAPVTMVAKELEDLAIELNPAIGYWDPLGLGSADFWGQGNDATVGFLRHAEIKHGRIAMFAFVGYIVQSNGIHFGFPLSLPEETNLAYAAGLTPPEQWDALTPQAKFQILVFIGFLEFCGELGASLAGGHYMKGGKPGDYPDFPAANVRAAPRLRVPRAAHAARARVSDGRTIGVCRPRRRRFRRMGSRDAPAAPPPSPLPPPRPQARLRAAPHRRRVPSYDRSFPPPRSK